MKVLNLQCAHLHRFEGWFASEDDYQSQLARALVACPVCSDTAIAKLPSAPRLNLGAQAPAATVQATSTPDDADAQGVQAALWQAARQLIANTEDVGPRFAQESRKMHYGEVARRSIRGQASHAEAQALQEEGIPVVALALPDALKGSLQ